MESATASGNRSVYRDAKGRTATTRRQDGFPW